MMKSDENQNKRVFREICQIFRMNFNVYLDAKLKKIYPILDYCVEKRQVEKATPSFEEY